MSCSFSGGPVVKRTACNAGDTVQSLVHEDPTCGEPTKPVSHDY